jgi:hypothetical protein
VGGKVNISRDVIGLMFTCRWSSEDQSNLELARIGSKKSNLKAGDGKLTF